MFLTGSGSVGIADMGMLSPVFSGKLGNLFGAGAAALTNTGIGLLTASMDDSFDVTAMGSTMGLLVGFTCLLIASIEVFLDATAVGSTTGFAAGICSTFAFEEEADGVCLEDDGSFDTMDFSP